MVWNVVYALLPVIDVPVPNWKAAGEVNPEALIVVVSEVGMVCSVTLWVPLTFIVLSVVVFPVVANWCSTLAVAPADTTFMVSKPLAASVAIVATLVAASGTSVSVNVRASAVPLVAAALYVAVIPISVLLRPRLTAVPMSAIVAVSVLLTLLTAVMPEEDPSLRVVAKAVLVLSVMLIVSIPVRIGTMSELAVPTKVAFTTSVPAKPFAASPVSNVLTFTPPVV
jgi:hypothetical protein